MINARLRAPFNSFTLLVILLLTACSSAVPRRDPTGQRFPTVCGESLDGKPVTLPDIGAGAPMLLLIGYEQNTQFDLDRWIIGITQMELKVRTFEVPTIPGLIPGMVSGLIDGGMRSGIPSEDWPSVVTLYSDASKVAAFTGTDNGLPGRIVLLNKDGVVMFFHDRGYSMGSLQKLRAALSEVK